jgi:hypothetical protein
MNDKPEDGRDAVTLVHGSSSLSAVDAAADTVTLAQPQGGGRTYRTRRVRGSRLTRVREDSMVVQFVHQYLSRVP